MGKLSYSIFILKNKKDYLVYVPDLDVNTEGKSLDNAIDMAKDVICLKLMDLQDMGKKLPKSTSYENVLKKIKDVKSIADFSKGIHTIVQVDPSEYRTTLMKKTVRRNVTIPQYLNDIANKVNLNVSNLLTIALKKKLNCYIKIPMLKKKTKINYL